MNRKVVVVAEVEEYGRVLIDELIGEPSQTSVFQYRKGALADISRSSPDVIIFQVSTPDKALLEMIKIITYSNPKPIIVLADERGGVNTEEVIKAGVSSYIVDGYKQGRMSSIIDVALARFSEHQLLFAELATVKEKLEDRKQIDKAKGVLMRLRAMNEDEAYRTMRNMAMENNKRLVDIAKSILSVGQVVN